MALVTARYSDGRTAAVHKVVLDWEERDLVILSEGDGKPLDRWVYNEIREISQPGSDGSLQLIDGHGIGARLKLHDSQQINECRRRCQYLSQKPDREPGWWKAYVFWIFTASASLALLIFVIIPNLADQIAKMIPYSWEQDLGQEVEQNILQVLARIDDREPAELICNNPAGLVALNRMVTPLASALNNDLEIIVQVVDTDMVNAITLPGGRILVFRGLLDKADHPNELAGVIGHEIGHVVHRHGLEGVISASAITGLISLLIGDVSGGLVIAGALEIAINSENSRDAEYEADDYGARLLEELGLDTKPMLIMFEKLGGQMPDMEILDWISSHPGMDDRIEKLKSINGQRGLSLTGKDWLALKEICQQ